MKASISMPIRGLSPNGWSRQLSRDLVRRPQTANEARIRPVEHVLVVARRDAAVELLLERRCNEEAVRTTAATIRSPTRLWSPTKRPRVHGVPRSMPL
jgi:hypothetical protein